MFPHRLTDTRAFDIAKALLEGFDRHYHLFRATSEQAKQRFEQADWHGQQRAQRERIEFYDRRVDEAVTRLQGEFDAGQLPDDTWQQVKLHYIGLLTNHQQPELAETFFNSVTTRILHHSYFHNDFIFVRPAVSTEYIESNDATRPTYRAYYPQREHWRDTWLQIVRSFELSVPFADLPRDVDHIVRALHAHMGDFRPRANFQIQVLTSLFFRNKGAYVVAKVINGFQETPIALPILHNGRGQLVIDTVLYTEDDLLMLFSYARAYFMVDMQVPSAYVQFLRSLMPRKPRAELYSALGLQKQGKNSFYRDFLYHLRHSTDQFRIAPGIKGMVMLVFDLPSFPFVFKLIKDYYPPQKDTTRELIKSKYLLVKSHDRVGRMADTLEYSNVAFPLDRFEAELVQEIRTFCPSLLEISDRDGDGQTELILSHVYIERRHGGGRHLGRGARRHRVRQRHQGSGGRQHLPRRHAVEELRCHAKRQGGVLRLRRDRVHHRLQLPPRARAAQRGRRDVRRDLVPRRTQGCVSRNLRALPAGQPRCARGVHAAPRRPAGCGLLAGPQGAHPAGPRARRLPLRSGTPLHPRRPAGGAAGTHPRGGAVGADGRLKALHRRGVGLLAALPAPA
jgi:isocitrate dehydrogenase kinase/phosphatase